MSKIIKVHAQFGLGNRLMAIASALRLQELGVFDQVRIQWEPHEHLNAKFTDILNNIEGATVAPPEEGDITTDFPKGGRIPVWDRIVVPAYAVFTTEDDETDHRTITTQLITAFKRIRFRPWFYDIADRWNVEGRTGLHCRRTDYPSITRPISQDQYSHFHHAIDEEFVNDIKESYAGPYFIASDSQQTSEYVINQLDDVFYRPKKHYPIWSARSLDTVTEGIIDLILLSRCTKIIADSTSTFSTSAAWMSNIEKIIWTRPSL